MYYVLNADGTRFGPASQELLQRWNAEGRIAPDARFLDAATESPVTREAVLPPLEGGGASPMPGMPPPGAMPGMYPTNPQPINPTMQPMNQAQYPASGQTPGYGVGQAPYQPQALYNAPGTPPTPYLTGGQYVSGAYGNPSHSPVIAALLTWLCIFPGYIYNKQAAKGVVMFIVAVGIGVALSNVIGSNAARLISAALTITLIVDSYKIAQRIQRGEAVGDWQFF